MLIDFISVEKLPWVVVWLDNMYHFYKQELYFFIALAIIHNWYETQSFSEAFQLSSVFLSMFVGFCGWVVWMAITKGYAVG